MHRNAATSFAHGASRVPSHQPPGPTSRRSPLCRIPVRLRRRHAPQPVTWQAGTWTPGVANHRERPRRSAQMERPRLFRERTHDDLQRQAFWLVWEEHGGSTATDAGDGKRTTLATVRPRRAVFAETFPAPTHGVEDPATASRCRYGEPSSAPMLRCSSIVTLEVPVRSTPAMGRCDLQPALWTDTCVARHQSASGSRHWWRTIPGSRPPSLDR